MTDALSQFLVHYLTAAEGLREPTYYEETYGLCHNSYVVSDEVGDELAALLKEEFGEDSKYLFGGMETYARDQRDGTQHLNPVRLAWIRKVLEQ